MPPRNRWMAFSLTGLFLAAAAGLAYAAVSEAAAAGVKATESDADEGDAPQVRHSQIKLVLDFDGSPRRSPSRRSSCARATPPRRRIARRRSRT